MNAKLKSIPDGDDDDDDDDDDVDVDVDVTIKTNKYQLVIN